MKHRSALAAVACAICASLSAFAASPKQFDIPAGPLVQALEALEKQAPMELIFQPAQLTSFRTAGVKGVYEPAAAIRALLQGTPLRLYTDANGAMVIALPHAPSASQEHPAAKPVSPPPADQRSSLPLGQTPGGSTATNNGVTSSFTPENAVPLQEVIVTAQKRSERLQDVPIPVTVINTTQLVSNGSLRLRDYYTSVPGFMVAPISIQTSQLLAIRGLVTGQGAPTVGVVIDDIPYGSSTALGGGQGIPDLDPGDLAQIEVLRGPQGSLYGANSLGGLVKVVTLDPSTSSVSGHVEAGTESVVNGATLGYNVRGSANVPISDTLAVRISGFRLLEPGWLDDPARGMKGVNEEVADGGMLSALWKGPAGISFKLDAMYQKIEDGSVPDASLLPNLGQLDQAYTLDTANSKEVQFYAGVLKIPLGPATLTSLSGYNISSFNTEGDASWLYGSDIGEPLFGVGGVWLTGNARTNKLSQELRLATPIGSMLDWLAGAYFTRENTQFLADLLGVNPQSQQVVGSVLNSEFPTTYKEYAAYTDLTLKVSSLFDIQAGGRYTKFKQGGFELDEGIYNMLFFRPPRSNPFITGPESLDADSATYLLTPRLRLTPDLMLYARVASGYRAGGINVTDAPGVPTGYGPDKTYNYEIGLKGDWLQHRLSVDASAYYINWRDIQLFLRSPTGAGYFNNGGNAKSEGLELTMQGRPLQGLTLSGWVAWNTAVLTQNFPATSSVRGLDGARLPYNMPFSGNLSAEQVFALPGDGSGYVGADLSYVDARLGEFVATGSRPYLPAYAKADAHAGLHYGTWSVDLFGNNLTDRRGILTRGEDTGAAPYAITYIQPRTVGVNVTKSF